MKLLLLTLFALALWAPSSTAARKNLKSPVRHLKAPAFSALNETELQRKHLTASELIRRKGVLEEISKSGASLERLSGETEVHHREDRRSVLKNSVLRKKEPTLSNLDGQSLRKEVVSKKQLVKVGKKVLGTSKTNSTSAVPESIDTGTNISIAQTGVTSPQKAVKENGGLISTKKAVAKEPGAPNKVQARKEHAITPPNSTLTQAGKMVSLHHRKESQAVASPAHRNAGQKEEGKELKVLHRNASRALLKKENLSPHWNTSWTPSRKGHGSSHSNASRTPMWKEDNTITKNSSRAQATIEPRFVQRNASWALLKKEHGTPSTNTSWSLPWQNQGVLQQTGSQEQAKKRLNVSHQNASWAMPRKGQDTLHRNASWVEARKDSGSSYKNASRALSQKKLGPSLRNASHALPVKKPSFPQRNASQVLSGKSHGSQHRNASWAGVNKKHRSSHKNASQIMPKKEPTSSHRNVGTEHGSPHWSDGQRGLGNRPGAPFRNITQTEAVKEQISSHRKGFQEGVGTHALKWQPAVPKERDAPIMPSLPTACLLSEHAIACGNTHLKHVPKLSDPILKTLYLAENEITNVPAGIFLGLPNLEWLDLSKNKLDSVGLHMEVFKNHTKLKRLNLDGNHISSIPALPSSLQELKLNDNNLEGLQKHSFRGLSKLLTLELEGNQLHDGNLLPTTFKPLRRLIYLRLDRNRFRTIPSGLPASLKELHLDSNLIEEVTENVLNKTLNLTVLVLSNNKLQEDRIAPRAWIDLPMLQALDLSYNLLAHVPSFLPRHLKQLTLHHNHIERIPGYVFAHMKPGLEFLHLSHNLLQDDGVHAVSFLGLYRSLAELLLDNNLFQAIPHGILNLKGLQVLRLSHNRIRHVPLNSVCDTRVAEDSNIVSMHLEHNLIDRRRIPPTAFSCIKAYHSVVLRPQQNEDDY